MGLKEVNVKSILAFIVVVFGMGAIVFVNIDDMALGAIIGFISMVLGYFFGSSKGSEAKDKMIQEMSLPMADAPEGDPVPPRGPKG